MTHEHSRGACRGDHNIHGGAVRRTHAARTIFSKHRDGLEAHDAYRLAMQICSQPCSFDVFFRRVLEKLRREGELELIENKYRFVDERWFVEAKTDELIAGVLHRGITAPRLDDFNTEDA